MLRFLRRHSIKWQLVSIGLIVLLGVSAISALSFWQYSKLIYEKNSDNTKELLLTIRNNIGTNVNAMNRVMAAIGYNEIVQQYITEQDPVMRYELYGQISKLIVNLKSLRQGIVDVAIIGLDGNSFNCNGCGEVIPQRDIPERSSGYYYTAEQWNRTKVERGIVAALPVYSQGEHRAFGTKIGYVLLLADVYAIAPEIRTISQKTSGQFYILDREDHVYSSNDLSSIGGTLVPYLTDPGIEWGTRRSGDDGVTYIVHREPLPELGGAIVSRIPVSELFSGLEDVQRIVSYSVVALLLIVLLFFWRVSRHILEPLRKFIQFIYSIRLGSSSGFQERVSLEGYKEITLMANKFNLLLREIDTLTDKLVYARTGLMKLELMKQAAELAFLKSQIQPHFLYNTLETMKGIAAYKEVDELYDMADGLAEVFRYSVKGEDTVTLREETAMVDAYLKVQQIRFGDRFETVRAYGEEELSCHVPKMVLQPIVENALLHGIEPSMTKCTLAISCRKDATGHLVMSVQDDGAGMDEAVLERIRRKLSDHERELEVKDHIGLVNVDKRLRFLYGDAGRLSIDSTCGEGTTVTMKIPLRGEQSV
ncbi:sensor histidine kinase [Paenibacillus sp. J5C_2022]|uniref:cache domain-containing sensor histidine kinase n=1 Tax=Paenibacillus sp. J5C2022 TaxID=2977129 RepID=UPI0021D18223|nr:sensor histidine kinase [Paenibacillus sp. J5C2022]MCU6713128.1 sensor histidine kinase [Paenibacillus sp. J5C2022]